MKNILQEGTEKCTLYGVGCSTGFNDINGNEINYYDKVYFREAGFIDRIGVVKHFFNECCIVVENDYGLVCAPFLSKQLQTVELKK